MVESTRCLTWLLGSYLWVVPVCRVAFLLWHCERLGCKNNADMLTWHDSHSEWDIQGSPMSAHVTYVLPNSHDCQHIYIQPQREETSLWVAVPCAQFPLLLWSLPFKHGIYFQMWLSCLRLSAEGLLRAVCCTSLWLAPMSPSGTQPSLPEGPPGAISSVSQTPLGWHHQLLKSEMHLARKSEILIFPSKVSFS